MLRSRFSRWDLRPSTSHSRPTSGGIKEGTTDIIVGSALPGAWSPFLDDEGNTYYVNDITGESEWEIPSVDAQGASGPSEDWSEAVGDITGYVAAADNTPAGEEHGDATWWDDGTTGGHEGNPFGGYAWPVPQAGDTGAAAHLEGYIGGGEEGYWEWDVSRRGEVDQGWTQEWDEGSQSYYWYNRLTGESRW